MIRSCGADIKDAIRRLVNCRAAFVVPILRGGMCTVGKFSVRNMVSVELRNSAWPIHDLKAHTVGTFSDAGIIENEWYRVGSWSPVCVCS